MFTPEWHIPMECDINTSPFIPPTIRKFLLAQRSKHNLKEARQEICAKHRPLVTSKSSQTVVEKFPKYFSRSQPRMDCCKPKNKSKRPSLPDSKSSQESVKTLSNECCLADTDSAPDCCKYQKIEHSVMTPPPTPASSKSKTAVESLSKDKYVDPSSKTSNKKDTVISPRAKSTETKLESDERMVELSIYSSPFDFNQRRLGVEKSKFGIEAPPLLAAIRNTDDKKGGGSLQVLKDSKVDFSLQTLNDLKVEHTPAPVKPKNKHNFGTQPSCCNGKPPKHAAVSMKSEVTISAPKKSNKNDCCDKPTCDSKPKSDPLGVKERVEQIKSCCKRKACVVARTICDMYEPMYKRCLKSVDTSGLYGDPKYHFLMSDASTSMTFIDGKKIAPAPVRKPGPAPIQTVPIKVGKVKESISDDMEGQIAAMRPALDSTKKGEKMDSTTPTASFVTIAEEEASAPPSGIELTSLVMESAVARRVEPDVQAESGMVTVAEAVDNIKENEQKDLELKQSELLFKEPSETIKRQNEGKRYSIISFVEEEDENAHGGISAHGSIEVVIEETKDKTQKFRMAGGFVRQSKSSARRELLSEIIREEMQKNKSLPKPDQAFTKLNADVTSRINREPLAPTKEKKKKFKCPFFKKKTTPPKRRDVVPEKAEKQEKAEDKKTEPVEKRYDDIPTPKNSSRRSSIRNKAIQNEYEEVAKKMLNSM